MLKQELMWTFRDAVRDVLEGDWSQFEEMMVNQLAEVYEKRAYHGLEHIRFIIDGLKEFDIPDREHALMILAAWFHDFSMYSIEDCLHSAESFMRQRGFNKEDITFVRHMIVSTEKGAVPHKNYEIALRQGQFRDTDWRILGLPPSTYNRYASLIETEYSHVPCDTFRNVRLDWLKDYAYRDRIFWIPEMEEKYGDQARANMQREIAWRDLND